MYPSVWSRVQDAGRNAGAGTRWVKVCGVVTVRLRVSEARLRVGDDGRGPAAARVYRVSRG